MKSILKVAVAAVLLLVGGMSVYAQQKISGTVVDVKGQAVIGASVLEKGSTSNGVIVDLDGGFTLTVPTGASVVVSCVGYVDKEFVVAAGQNNYEVILSEDAELLEETVVIGYGTVRVRDLTGSVTAVSSKDIDVPVANVAQALQGKMPGVVVTNAGGSPGATPTIRVRGAKSITQTNNPLFIVDGFPVSSLSNIPGDQIKSINVLKDAAATAIYGSRGAAGVILVTTKNAVEGQTSVSYNGYVQIKDSSNSIQDVLQPLDYLKFTLGYARDYNVVNYENMLKYFGIGAEYGNHYQDYVGTKSHNYQNDVMKTGISHSHNVAISSGTKKNKTMVNLNYVYDDGTVINSWYNRINASVKNILNLTDNFTLETNISYYFSESKGNSSSGQYTYRAIDKPMGDPTLLAGFGNGSSSQDASSNDPIKWTYNTDSKSESHNFRAITALNWVPIKGLTFRTELGLAKGFGKSQSYSKGYANSKRTASVSRSDSGNMHWSTTAQYQLPFADQNVHRADIMVGTEMIRSNSSSNSISAWQFPENFSTEQALAFIYKQYTEDFSFSNDYGVPGRSLSFFTRANYTLLDKYMFTFTLRADGSSKFAPNNRWGYFPAGAFAWRVSDEDFMDGTKDWLSNLKFRLSYGISGSDAISVNLWKETWSAGGNSNYTISQQRTDTELDYASAYAPGSMMMNPDLKWETTATANVGIDFGLFNERLHGTIEGYWITTDGLLMPVNVNEATGYTYQYQNMGKTSNKGIELQIGGDIVRNNDFTLSANFILNYNINRIEELSESVQVTNYGVWANSEHVPSTGEFSYQVGKALGTIRAYKYLGWYTTDDFNYDPATGVYTLKPGIPDFQEDSYWTSLGRPAGQTAFPGCIKFEDVNGDGKLTGDDTYEFGEMMPRLTGSFNINARWKNFDLSANFNYVLGGHIMNVEALYSSYGSKDNRFGYNRLSFVKDCYFPYRWNNGELEHVSDPVELEKMNAGATMHTPTSMKGFLIDKFLEDASYLRLKNLTVGYTFPKQIAQKLGMKNLRAYFTGSNLLTLTGYSGLDPEVSFGDTTPGIDSGTYPMPYTYTIGLNITF